MAERRKLPRSRRGKTTSFRITSATGGKVKGYLTTGEFPDTTLGEIFLKVAKQGSTLSGLLDGFSIMTSLALQHGVPVATIVEHLNAMHFEPFGNTDDPDLVDEDDDPIPVKSILDYVAKRLAKDYLSEPEAQIILDPPEIEPPEEA